MAEHDLQSIAFPTLDEAQIAELATCTTATPKLYRDSQTLFAVGERNFKFHVIKSGEVEIIDYSGDVPKTVAAASAPITWHWMASGRLAVVSPVVACSARCDDAAK